MCKKNIHLIQDRVLLQTLPSNAYSTEKTVHHALQYDKEFARAGICRDRYCIKIPATGPALNAAKLLSEQGIATLGTALFGLPQAIACSQADCKYVSAYFNGKTPLSESKGPGVEMRLTPWLRGARTRGPVVVEGRRRPCERASHVCPRVQHS